MVRFANLERVDRIISFTPSSTDSTWNELPTPSPYLHEQLDVRFPRVRDVKVRVRHAGLPSNPQTDHYKTDHHNKTAASEDDDVIGATDRPEHTRLFQAGGDHSLQPALMTPEPTNRCWRRNSGYRMRSVFFSK